jgi:hypothetical protein
MPNLTVKFKGRHSLYSEYDTREDTVKLLRSEMNARITRKSGTMCVGCGRSLLLSHCYFSLLNGSALRLFQGTATSTTRSIIHHSFMHEYTSVTHAAVMPYVCLQYVIPLCFYKSVY